MKILKYVILFFVGYAFFSCNDFLQVAPESDMTASSFWKTPNDANSGVQSIYFSFSKAIGAHLWDWGDFKADEFFFINPQTAMDQVAMVANVVKYDNQGCQWSDLYQTIGRANAAIKYIPQITMSVTDQNRLLASAYTLRAWSYFYLVRVWGDVPMPLVPFEKMSNDVYLRRTKRESVNKKIISDLLKADSLLGPSSFANKKYVTRGLVYSLEMDVYAWLHQYDKVEKVMLQKVQPLVTAYPSTWGLGFTLSANFSPNWRTIFWDDPTVSGTNLPKEVIFKMAYSRTENGTNQSKYFWSVASSNNAYYTPNFKSSYVTTDLRFATMGYSTYMSKKFFSDTEASSIMDNDLVLYRYADVVLLYAEALCMLNKFPESITELNRTRVRAGLTAYTTTQFTTQSALLDAILFERKLEFAGEGKRWFDLVRTNTYTRKGDSTDDPNSLFFPIYRDNVLNNPNLSLPPID